jgi:hypothetical protein
MSQVAELPEPDVAESYEPEPMELQYRPVPVSAVVGCVLGVLSAIALLGITGAVVAVLGILVCGYSLVRILASRGELGGKMAAATGLGLSVLFLGSGIAYQSHLYKTELPPGFQRISFAHDISQKGLVNVEGQMAVHPDVSALVGKKVFLKGFMYPPDDPRAMTSFLLVKDSEKCCFGGKPNLVDMIGVQMEPGKTVDYYNGKVSVAGELEINTEYSGQYEREPIFLMKGHLVSKSKTDLE